MTDPILSLRYEDAPLAESSSFTYIRSSVQCFTCQQIDLHARVLTFIQGFLILYAQCQAGV